MAQPTYVDLKFITSPYGQVHRNDSPTHIRNSYTTHPLMVYIYWPRPLLLMHHRSQKLFVVAYADKGADLVVLHLIKEDIYKPVQAPYACIGTVDCSGTFQYQREGMPAGTERVMVIEFTPPKLTLMQFFSMDPISLILPEKLQNDPFVDEAGGHSNMLELLAGGGVSRTRLRGTLDVINMYYRHMERFERQYPDYADARMSLRQRWSRAKRWLGTTWAFQVLCTVVLYVVMSVRVMAGAITTMLNWRHLPLIAASTTMQQIDLRAQQLCYIPVQYLRIHGHMVAPAGEPRMKAPGARGRRRSVSFQTLPCEFYPDYIRLYNTLWLIANDVSLGVTFAALLVEKREPLAAALQQVLRAALYELPMRITRFLNESPFGIKLNGELSKFLSELFTWIMDFVFRLVIKRFTEVPVLEHVIMVVAHVSSVVGVTFALALIIDGISVLSLHISLFYLISAKLYRWQLHVMTSFFYLFCGKKINVLRKRVDNDTFQLDQVLMGTLLFIVLIFLLPTVFAYYLTYTLIRVVLTIVPLLLEASMALLNHFPLFALLLRIKDPMRLPGGIYFQLKHNRFALNSNPLKVSMMFQSYLEILTVIRDKFMSLNTLRSIIAGEPIMVHRLYLYQVLYSSLPIKPIDAALLWTELQRLMTWKDNPLYYTHI
ncbi:AaceriACL142Wp [[Ashbya] aceris (nom. inval.)]|nr:AaceriACL142Wp [[Ashbya] aceris (nom. inval.)]